MTELSQFRKVDLTALAAEFEVAICATDTVIKIIKKIESSPDYDKGLALAQVKLIQEERLENIEQEKVNREWESAKKEKDRVFELEKLKIAQVTETVSLESSTIERNPKVSLKNVTPSFDPETSDMSLFLTLF